MKIIHADGDLMDKNQISDITRYSNSAANDLKKTDRDRKIATYNPIPFLNDLGPLIVF